MKLVLAVPQSLASRAQLMERAAFALVTSIRAEDIPRLQGILRERAKHFSRTHSLTSREREVFYGMALGLDRNQIATVLEISPSTIATHLRAIRGKVGIMRVQSLWVCIELAADRAQHN